MLGEHEHARRTSHLQAQCPSRCSPRPFIYQNSQPHFPGKCKGLRLTGVKFMLSAKFCHELGITRRLHDETGHGRDLNRGMRARLGEFIANGRRHKDGIK